MNEFEPIEKPASSACGDLAVTARLFGNGAFGVRQSGVRPIATAQRRSVRPATGEHEHAPAMRRIAPPTAPPVPHAPDLGPGQNWQSIEGSGADHPRLPWPTEARRRRILFEAGEDDGVEVAAPPARCAMGSRRFITEHAPQRLNRGRALKRRTTRERLRSNPPPSSTYVSAWPPPLDPAACSGPYTAGCAEHRPASSAATVLSRQCVRPKSATLGAWSIVNRMLAGFRSRCTTP